MTPEWRQVFRDLDVLVLGATGFIGRWVARALSDAGAILKLPARDPAAANELARLYGIRGEWFHADLADLDATADLIRRNHPAAVFNLAGYGVYGSERDEQTAYRINLDLVRVVAETLSSDQGAPWPGQRLVHVGSGFEYGSAPGDLSEHTRPLPGTLYGRSKFAGTEALTQICEQTGLRAITARPFTVFGPGERAGRLLPSLIDATSADSTIPLTAGLQKRDFVYVEDVAEGLLRLACSAAEPGATVNLATGRLISVRDFILAAAEVLDISERRLDFGRIPTRAEEMQHDPVATALLESLTGWRPATPLKEGIRRTDAFQARPNS